MAVEQYEELGRGKNKLGWDGTAINKMVMSFQIMTKHYFLKIRFFS